MTMWRPDGTGIQPGGDVGGDVQAGESFSVRFVHARRPGSLVTVYCYPAETGDGAYRVDTQIEYLVCTDPRDPGGTEEWAQARYEQGTATYTDLAAAERAAHGRAARFSPAEITWDGNAPWK